MLYRYDARNLSKPDVLVTGLQRHIAAATLTSTVMQIGAHQQTYVALDGCAGCATHRCVPGCRVELLRRTLRAACGPSTQLQPTSGLVRRPYQQIALAAPGKAAQPLTADMLHPYHDARLSVVYGPLGSAWCSSVVLLADANGPNPAALLRERGWRPLPLPHHRQVVQLAWRLSTVVRPAARWPHAPALLVACDRPPQGLAVANVDVQAIQDAPVFGAGTAVLVVAPTPPGTTAPPHADASTQEAEILNAR